MFLKIILVVICVCICLLCIILFSPVFFTFNNKKRPYDAAAVSMHIIHPFVMRYTYIFSLKKYEITFCNRFTIGSLQKREKKEPQEELSEPEEEISDKKQEAEKDLKPREASIGPEKEAVPEKEIPVHATAAQEPVARYIPPAPPKQEPEPERYHKTAFKKEKKRKKDTHPLAPEDTQKKTFRSRYAQFKRLFHFMLNQKKIALKAIAWLRRVIRRCFRVITFHDFSMHLQGGFTDPSYTGMLHGFFTGVFHGLDMQGNNRISIDFVPQFENRDMFLFEGAVSIKTSPAQLLWPVGIAILTFPYISVFILWRRIKKFKRSESF